MKTVPTLCATATVVGASAVGLSFGREGPLDASNTRRKATPARDGDPRPMPAAVQTALSSSLTTTPPAFSSPLSLPRSSSSSRVPAATRLSYDGRRLLRRMTSEPTTALTLPSAAAHRRPPPSRDGLDTDETDPALQRPSRRASWIKRLSMVSTSQQSSRNSSPGPLSPSVSCSNGSMAFSHDGSTAPIVHKRSPSPLPPNKLVKRSSSVHVAQDSQRNSSASRLPSLRRPATSHQRSATMQQSALMETAVEQPPAERHAPLPRQDSDVQYTQFFTAKVSKERTLTKRRASTSNAKALKRIFPDDRHKPTLLLATSVAAGDAEVDDSASDDGESVFFVSRPGTPMSITAVISTRAEALSALDSKPGRNRTPTEVAEDASRPRRSFSITDFLSLGSDAKKPRATKLPGAKLSRKSSQRVSSAPLPTMSSRPTHTAHGAPSARRDLTDPLLARRDISTSAGPPETGDLRNGLYGNSSSSPLPALSPHRAAEMPDETPAPMRQSDVKPAVSASTNHVPPSPTLAQTGGRPSRHSVAPSEQASTLVGSDNEARGLGSGDEDDVDLQSETVFDSLRTGATRSTSGARGPRIETIFDESPPSKIKVTALRDLLPKGTFREHSTDDAPRHQSIITEEDESISTPVRTIVPERSINESPSLYRGQSAPLFPNLITSSPPDMPKPLSLGRLEWDARAGDDDNASKWSIDEEEEEPWADYLNLTPATHVATPVSLGRHNPRLLASGSSPKPSTPQNAGIDYNNRDARSSIFDWSEQAPADKSSGNRTPPRPRTVHGKKDADRRGSRSVGRRAPSGLHARSQSVPVVPDAAGKRSTVITNKFGTWGVGSKGVSEDWNDDFDFSELHEEPVNGAADSQRIDSGTAMVVPKTIQEQQSNVLANIGLLREWGLLIEELKEQRVRAITLGLLEGPNAGMWEEVDAMIDLADQEAEQDGVPRLSPPSSPGFDEDAFDDVSGSSPNHGRGRRESGGKTSEDLGMYNSQPVPHTNRPRRKSILLPTKEIFEPQSSPLPSRPKQGSPFTPSHSKPVTTRPRKDSEAKARSVIEALQKRKSIHDQVADLQLTPSTKKVPFDTATLRRIVPYVNTLTRKVKEALRDAEGLYSSPSTSPHEPPFSKIFHTDNDLTAQMKLMTVM
ncbi:hypothetical protein P154DRAFT_125271 [Amniculicola lignicola CBS 123094]|uniref:Uncharacterized protein n=1 Tax=Amniculicola lignicola CBS 123094 TaxID=1392246 RepID=A0A6A5WM04_9PLEO|nr:hypothetical protein P154DRAFT_125271 [Amniculicola lignicola CBS 123094]